MGNNLVDDFQLGFDQPGSKADAEVVAVVVVAAAAAEAAVVAAAEVEEYSSQTFSNWGPPPTPGGS